MSGAAISIGRYRVVFLIVFVVGEYPPVKVMLVRYIQKFAR